MIPILPSPPPASRYSGVFPYGFYLEREVPVPIDQLVSSVFGDSPSSDYVELNLNPQQVSLDEPMATAITFTQGGGKFIESRGGLVLQGVIQGTTGFLPPPNSGSVASVNSSSALKYTGKIVDLSDAAEASRAARSGFAAFYKLRQLFRVFRHERRLGNFVVMHYMDFAGDDFWIIEPLVFSMRQSISKKTMRDYEIRFTCIEPSGASSKTPLGRQLAARASVISSAMQDLPVDPDPRNLPDSGVLTSAAGTFSSGLAIFNNAVGSVIGRTTGVASSIRTVIARYRSLVNDGRSSLSFTSGEEQRALRAVLDDVESLTFALDSTEGLASDIAVSPAVLASNIDASVMSFFEIIGKLHTPEELGEGIEAEYNEFMLQVQNFNDHVRASFNSSSRDSFANRARADLQNFADARANGASSDVIPETGRPLKTNPFLGIQGLEMVVDIDALSSVDGFSSVAVQRGETIYDVARRCLGNIHRFVELVILNDLDFPFIVSSVSDKPPGTIAWGEFIKVPVTSQSDSEAAVGPNQPPNAVFGGTVSTTGTNQEVIDTHKETPWRENQWVGYTVEVTNGAAILDPVRLVVSNTADTLEVNRPWTTNPAVGDTFTISLREFTLRIPPTPEELAFGRDVLLIWNQKRGDRPNPFEADIVRNSRGDYATIAGFENYHQALMLLFATPKGEHPFHPRYGVGLPIGRPFNLGTAPLYNFFVRQSILDDPRTASVAKSLLKFEGGAYSYQAEVMPVNVHKAKQVNLVVGGG